MSTETNFEPWQSTSPRPNYQMVTHWQPRITEKPDGAVLHTPQPHTGSATAAGFRTQKCMRLNKDHHAHSEKRNDVIIRQGKEGMRCLRLSTTPWDRTVLRPSWSWKLACCVHTNVNINMSWDHKCCLPMALWGIWCNNGYVISW